MVIPKTQTYNALPGYVLPASGCIDLLTVGLLSKTLTYNTLMHNTINTVQ